MHDNGVQTHGYASLRQSIKRLKYYELLITD